MISVIITPGYYSFVIGHGVLGRLDYCTSVL